MRLVLTKGKRLIAGAPSWPRSGGDIRNRSGNHGRRVSPTPSETWDANTVRQEQRLVRRAVRSDAPTLRALAIDNGMFAPDEMGDFDRMLNGYLDGDLRDHVWVVLETAQGEVMGAAYYAPEPFADRMWNLYFIAVSSLHHRDGVGGALLAHVEDTLRGAGESVARVLIVETSSLGAYEHARSFYATHGYDEEARIRDFYGPGDNKVVFWKLVAAPA
jgi:ribosomal protein S18 acetylase RimI-like enzyme